MMAICLRDLDVFVVRCLSLSQCDLYLGIEQNTDEHQCVCFRLFFLLSIKVLAILVHTSISGAPAWIEPNALSVKVVPIQ